ncbi:hypothetical protein MIDIC_480002 [Alphaproteobacteria bacterium]
MSIAEIQNIHQKSLAGKVGTVTHTVLSYVNPKPYASKILEFCDCKKRTQIA